MNLKQDDRELLLNFLCMKLPFGAMCLVKGDNTGTLRKLIRIEVDGVDGVLLDFLTDREDRRPIQVYLSEVIPCVKPMSSMTEEEHDEWFGYYHEAELKEVKSSGDYFKAAIIGESYSILWLLKNNFDFMELISKGLAKDITKII